MDDTGHCKSGYWACRFEVLGAILVLIATCLTIITLQPAGIFMLFVTGLVLCFHKCVSGSWCHNAWNCKDVACEEHGRKAVKGSKAKSEKSE